jgi:dUTPase
VLVKRGDRIAQLICEKIEMPNLVKEDVRTLFFLMVLSID